MDVMPKHVAALVAELHAERAPLAERLDAIDLAIENLRRIWPVRQAAPKAARKAHVKPQPLHVVGDDSEAAKRRALLLSVIAKSPVGLTLGELRAQTPKMDGKDRSNALQIMKTQKQIRRAGNAWVAVPEAAQRIA